MKYTESEVLVQSELRSIIHTYIHFPRLYFAAINMIFKLNVFQFECCFISPGYSSREKRGNCSITTQTVTLFLLLSDSFRCQNLTRQRTQVQDYIQCFSGSELKRFVKRLLFAVCVFVAQLSSPTMPATL